MLLNDPESGPAAITPTVIGEPAVEVRDSYGITCPALSHNLPNSMMIGDKICMLYTGKITAGGSPEPLNTNPDPVTQQFPQGKAYGSF